VPTDLEKLAAEYGGTAQGPLQVTVRPVPKQTEQDFAALAAEYGGTAEPVETIDVPASDYAPESETDLPGLMAGVLRGGGPTALGGMAGATIGSVIPGVGTVAGGLAGAAAGGLTDMFGDPIVSGVNALFGTNITPPSESFRDLLTATGIPLTDTGMERTAESVARNLSGAGAGIAGGKMLMAQGGPVASRVGEVLASSPGAQAVGATAAGIAGQGVEEMGGGPIARAVAEIGTGGLLAGGKAIADKLAEMISSRRMAMADLAELGIDPAALRTAYAEMQAALGRAPSMAEVLGEAVSRLRPTLAPEPGIPARIAETALAGRTGTILGTRERASAVDMASAAQDASEASIRERIGAPAFDPDVARRDLQAGVRERLAPLAQIEEAQALAEARARPQLAAPEFNPDVAQRDLQAGFRERMAGVPAATRAELDARVEAIDEEMYGRLRDVQTFVAPDEIAKLNKFIASLPFDNEDAQNIRRGFSEGFITGDTYERMRRGLRDLAARQKLSRDVANDRVRQLDDMFDRFMPQVAEARQASFKARSAAEGATQAQNAVKELGANPVTEGADLRLMTPEQKAGAPLGGAQGVLDRTSDPAKAERFAEKLTNDPDYAANLRSVLPAGLGNTLIEWATPARARVEQLRTLGLPDAAGNPAKFEKLTEKLLDDPNFLATLRERAPAEMVDSLVNFARVQRDVVQRAKTLGLDKAADTPAKARAFAERVDVDPKYAEGVRAVLPYAAAESLITYARQGRTVIDQLDALGLTGVGGDPAKFRAMTNKLLEDKAFVDTMRRRLPKELVDDAVNYARVQRDFIQKVDDLGLTNIGKDFGNAYRFAERAELDPTYAQSVATTLPGGDELVRFALQNKKAVDSISALLGVAPQKIATMADDVKGVVDASILSFGSAGGAMQANTIMRFLTRNFGLGKGPAKAMADMLLDPKKFEPTMKALEARGVDRKSITGVMRGALFSAAINGGVPPEMQEEPQ
jgi:hypothetical protein